jgi:hypothetical protein
MACLYSNNNNNNDDDNDNNNNNIIIIIIINNVNVNIINNNKKGVFPFSCHTCLAWEALSCRPASPLSLLALRVCLTCDLLPLFALSHMHALHRTALHLPAARYLLLPIGTTGAHLTARQRPCPNAELTQPGMDCFSGALCRFPRVGRLEGHGIAVLGFPCPRRSCPARAVAHNSYLLLPEYGNAVL